MISFNRHFQYLKYLSIFLCLFAFNTLATAERCVFSQLYFDFDYTPQEFKIDYPDCDTIVGDVVLSNQTNVDLGATGLEKIITIDGSLRVDKLMNLDGFSNLELVTGNFNAPASSQPNLESFHFPKLKEVGGDFGAGNYQNKPIVNFDLLERIGGTLYMGNSTYDLEKAFTSLRIIGGDFVTGIWTENELFPLTGFPELDSVYGHFIMMPTGARTITGFNNLDYVGADFIIQQNFRLESIDGFNDLQTVNGNFSINYNELLNSLSGFGSLQQTNDFAIFKNAIEGELNFPNLEITGHFGIAEPIFKIKCEKLQRTNDFSISNCNALTELVGFENLIEIDGRLRIFENSQLVNVLAFEKLESTFEFYLWNNPKLIAFRGLDSLNLVTDNLSITDNTSLKEIPSFDLLDSLNVLRILDTDLDSLVGFNKVELVSGTIIIEDNPALKFINGFDSAVWLEDFRIVNNDSLEEIQGFNNLESINKNFSVNGLSLNDIDGFVKLKNVNGDFSLKALNENLDGFNNLLIVNKDLSLNTYRALRNISGFQNLVHIGQELRITNCPNLVAVTGLNMLNRVDERIEIEDCSILTDLSGLYNIAVGRTFIRRCPLLNNCNEPRFCAMLVRTKANIIDSGLDCNGFYGDSEKCPGIDLLTGRVYYDVDENGSFDVEDVYMENVAVIVNNNLVALTNDRGIYMVPAEDGEQITISLKEQQGFFVTTTPEEHDFIFDVETTPDMSYNFGVKYEDLIQDAKSDVSGLVSVCNEVNRFNLRFTNLGSERENLIVKLKYNELVEFTGTVSLPPDSIDLENRVMSWEFGNVAPFISNNISLTFQVANEQFLGEFIKLESSVQLKESDELLSRKINEHEIFCAYDPNDKAVSPPGVGNKHQTLIGSTLSYTIRFQNLGNFPARNVIIKDTLSELLNINSLRVVNSSHSVQTSYEERGSSLELAYYDIYLPDSLSNPEESQGFVTFEIDPISMIEEGDLIENKASIYFDKNPAIVTNTAFNTMVTDILTAKDIQNKEDVILYPNPTSDFVKVVSLTGLTPVFLDLRSVTGSRMNLELSDNYISLERLSPGIYFLYLQLGKKEIVKKIVKH